MELCLGQRLRNGSIGVWNIVSPYLDGLGLASVVICIMVCLYYNVILSWCLIYLVNSFQSPLPWSQCPKTTIQVGKNLFKSGPSYKDVRFMGETLLVDNCQPSNNQLIEILFH